jgi:hypothetical protein
MPSSPVGSLSLVWYSPSSLLVQPSFRLDWLVLVSQTHSSRKAYSSPWWQRQWLPLKCR